ncbi:MAG: VCBS repeat-containing protein [Candidatus Cloacimonetes bacterium]|nr:VCBS repeat-containing protein [Candidatus Cloacimonadota bacterium]
MRYSMLILCLFLVSSGLFSVDLDSDLKLVETYGNISEIKPGSTGKSRNTPDSVLVILVEFTDVKFDSLADYPDFIPHDRAYFHRLLFHLSSYFADVSHGIYTMISESDTLYTLWQEIITLPQAMGYYGEDKPEGGDMIERKVQLVVDTVNLLDPSLDFSGFDSFLIFHAGTGQESHYNTNPELIQSTFLSRKSFQAGLDPENDDFPGILTNDDVYIREVSIFPESQNLPDPDPEETLYGMLGILAQGFGYQLGLPTLFDNVDENGRSFGIGFFGVMGYGVWCANGYVPPLPCAWSRYYLGWEDDNLVVLNQSDVNLPLVFPMADDDQTPKVYKILISDNEYFLLENRQQNPDGSFFVNNQNDSLATFSFQLVEDQEYYPPEHPYAGQPKFDFMKNSYTGCEWDFYLPGYGYGDDLENDGSGILIWHIDENVIQANFTPGYEINTVNGDASHKGVDLEEADGIQHLDSVINEYSLGSPFDAYRLGNNIYFGKMYPEPGVISLPTSESYYGGIQLEISNISGSDSLMTFSVDFEWSLNTSYFGDNIYNATLADIDFDNDPEIFYPMPDGRIYLWKDFELSLGYPLTLDSLAAYYAYDEFNRTFLIPTYNSELQLTRLAFVSENGLEYPLSSLLGYDWAAGPVVIPYQDSPYRVILPLQDQAITQTSIMLLDDNYTQAGLINIPDLILIGNLMLLENRLYALFKNGANEVTLIYLNLADMNQQLISLATPPSGSIIINTLAADLDRDGVEEIIFTTSDTTLFAYSQGGNLLPGFPVTIPLPSLSLPALADIDGNGYLDILIGGQNSFVIIDKNGNIFRPHQELSNPDSLYPAAGVIALDFDGDGQLEIIGNMSRNRLAVWENRNSNTYELNRYYPVSFARASLNYPLPVSSDDLTSFLYLAANDGTIYRHEIPHLSQNNHWVHEFGNLQRTASYLDSLPENTLVGKGLFNLDHTYIYPNPLNSIFPRSIHKGFIREEILTLKIMTRDNASVKVRIFDIAGNLIQDDILVCEAYLGNDYQINAEKLSSGVYFALISARGESLRLKFAIEK